MFSQVCKARGWRWGGGGTAVYGLYRYVPAVKGMVFKEFALGYSIYIRKLGISFQETDQLVEDFSVH